MGEVLLAHRMAFEARGLGGAGVELPLDYELSSDFASHGAHAGWAEG